MPKFGIRYTVIYSVSDITELCDLHEQIKKDQKLLKGILGGSSEFTLITDIITDKGDTYGTS